MSERRNPIIALVRTAMGRADGPAKFGNTVPSFLNSLAPLLAFPIAGALVEAYRENWISALSLLLLTLVAQLAPAVLSHVFAVRWRVEENWLRYATAYNWCNWAIPLVAAVLTFVLAVAVAAGLPSNLAAQGVIGGVGLYTIWLNWFIARHALGIGGWRALLLVVAVTIGTMLLTVGPALLG